MAETESTEHEERRGDAVGIALRGKAESLNVAVAAGVLLFAMVKAEG